MALTPDRRQFPKAALAGAAFMRPVRRSRCYNRVELLDANS